MPALFKRNGADLRDDLAHRRVSLVDAWWQMHCRLELVRPPAFDLGRTGRDLFYRLLAATWMAQQLSVAAGLFLAGGWGWVVGGVCVRVTLPVTGHWFVGRLAHRTGPQSWLVEDAGVQAHGVLRAAIPTTGEAWHNHHHAFPRSARTASIPAKAIRATRSCCCWSRRGCLEHRAP